MPVGKVQIGQGSTLGYKFTGDSVFTLINNLKTITPPDVERQDADKSKLTSTFVQKRTTIPDLGELGFAVQFDYEDTTHQRLKTELLAYPADEGASWQITEPEGTTCTFGGWLKKFTEDEYEVDQITMAEGAVVVTSVPVYVAGSGG
jgi:hypothetical protein